MGIAIVGDAGKRLVGFHHGDGDRVDELSGITIVEGYPYGLRSVYIDIEMQRAQMGLAVEKENQVLASAQVGALITIGDDTHSLDALRHTHVAV